MCVCYTTKEEKAKEKNRARLKHLHARNDASMIRETNVVLLSKLRQALQDFAGKNREGPKTFPFQRAITDLSVSLLADESWDVEIVNARSAHHWPWEVVGRPCYET